VDGSFLGWALKAQPKDEPSPTAVVPLGRWPKAPAVGGAEAPWHYVPKEPQAHVHYIQLSTTIYRAIYHEARDGLLLGWRSSPSG